MGSGLSLECPKCKELYSFNLGCGYLFFQNHTKTVLYYCPKCGNWESKDIKTNTMSREFEENSEDISKEKRHLLSCSKCKTRMRKLKDFNSEKLPVFICKNCN